MNFNTIENTTSKVSGVLVDEIGGGVGIPVVTALVVSLMNRATGAYINSRDHVNVLNMNGGSLDGSGNFAWVMSPGDNVIIDDALDFEVHTVLLEFTYGDGRQGKKLIDIAVQNIVRTIPVVPGPNVITVVGPKGDKGDKGDQGDPGVDGYSYPGASASILKVRLKVDPGADSCIVEDEFVKTVPSTFLFYSNVGVQAFIAMTSTLALERISLATLEIVKTSSESLTLHPVRYLRLYTPSPNITVIQLYDSTWAPYTLQAGDAIFRIDFEIHVYPALP